MNTQPQISKPELIPAGVHTSRTTMMTNNNFIASKSDNHSQPKQGKKNNSSKKWKNNLRNIGSLKQSDSLNHSNRKREQSNMYLFAVIK